MEDNGLILGLLKTYEDPEPRFADFAIHCTGPKGDETVWCHKILLVLRSGYFDGLLRMEPETKSISLPDFSLEVVRAVVKSAIAVDEEELTKVGLIEVLQLADFLQMEHLIKSVSPMISEMLDLTNISDIYNLAQSSYFPDLLQDTEHFIKENLLMLNNDMFTDMNNENLVKFFSTFTQPQTQKVGQHGWMLDKVEISELILDKLITILEAKDQVPNIQALLPQCFDRSIIYFIFTHDQDLFEGQHGQMAYFPESNIGKERFAKLLEYMNKYCKKSISGQEIKKYLKVRKFPWQGKCYHWQGSYGSAPNESVHSRQRENFVFEGLIRKIGIKTRLWDDRKIVQGFKVTLVDGSTKAFGMTLNDGRNVEEFEVPEGQHIQSVILRSGWYIDTFGVVTNAGLRFKVGGSGGDERRIVQGKNTVLVGISGNVVMSQNEPCICQVKFKFFTYN